MPPCLLVWALPDEWVPFDVDDPATDEAVRAELQQRWSSCNLDATAADLLLHMPLKAVREARHAGTLLWAIRTMGDGSENSPVSTISLSISLTDQGTDAEVGAKVDGPAGVESIRARAKPLPLDRAMTGFVVEGHLPVFDDLSIYNAQVFVSPRSIPVLAVVSVTTMDGSREQEARDAASFVARSLHFVMPEET